MCAPTRVPANPVVVRQRAVAHVATTACLLIAMVVPVRATTVGFWFIPTLLDWRGQLPVALMTAGYDVLFVLAFTLPVVAWLLWLPMQWTWLSPERIVQAHRALASFTLVAGLANIPVVAWLGQPFTFQWLYYSDFLRSVDAMMAVAEAIDWWHVVGGLVCGALFWVLSRRFALRVEGWWMRSRAVRGGAVALGGLLAVGVGYADHWLRDHDWRDGTVSNPVWSFVASCVRASYAPEVFSMPTPVPPDDFLAPSVGPDGQPASSLPAQRVVPRNVIFFVLESVSARYVGLYGGEHGVTPELDRRRGQAAIFDHAYAHAPATNMTLLSLFSGVYPRVSFRLSLNGPPGVTLPSITGTLRARGLATGFFASAPLDFQRADEFLRSHGSFDVIQDSRDRPPPESGVAPPWPAAAGTSDAHTVESLIEWIGARGEQPYFATLWTMQTHFPYYVSGGEKPLAAGVQFNRYLNALAESDRALGRLLDWLEATQRAADTLVVVLGDHGEAFGLHGNHGHAGHVFEENIHIPLVLIHPQLFDGRRYDANCGIVDLVPTVADVLRLPFDSQWQGRSLFSTERTDRVYFFAAWSDFMLGYREGDMKRIYNAGRGVHVTFDLRNDPEEQRNLAPSLDAAVHRETTHRIATWVQHVERTFSIENAAAR